MSFGPSVWLWRWGYRSLRLGAAHPASRAAFGRYVGARGGSLGDSAGVEALTACIRYLQQPGYLNRSFRRHLSLSSPRLCPAPLQDIMESDAAR